MHETFMKHNTNTWKTAENTCFHVSCIFYVCSCISRYFHAKPKHMKMICFVACTYLSMHSQPVSIHLSCFHKCSCKVIHCFMHFCMFSHIYIHISHKQILQILIISRIDIVSKSGHAFLWRNRLQHTCRYTKLINISTTRIHVVNA